MTSSTKIEHFRRWVFLTGIFNIVTFSSLACPYTLKNFLKIMTDVFAVERN